MGRPRDVELYGDENEYRPRLETGSTSHPCGARGRTCTVPYPPPRVQCSGYPTRGVSDITRSSPHGTFAPIIGRFTTSHFDGHFVSLPRPTSYLTRSARRNPTVTLPRKCRCPSRCDHPDRPLGRRETILGPTSKEKGVFSEDKCPSVDGPKSFCRRRTTGPPPTTPLRISPTEDPCPRSPNTVTPPPSVLPKPLPSLRPQPVPVL